MTYLTTFESGAVRTELPVRYDLCSKIAVRTFLEGYWGAEDSKHEFARDLLTGLLGKAYGPLDDLYYFVSAVLDSNDNNTIVCYILSAYARTMHEGAAKYGERTWEKGIPEANLKNHAINHLIKYLEGDKTEPHLDHLMWNVLTIIHFRELEDQTLEQKGDQKNVDD